MRNIILLSHGNLASGMRSMVELVAGKQDSLFSYDAYVDGNEDVKPFLDEFLHAHPNQPTIIITDILGGSVNNDALTYNHLPLVYVVSGINAALIINMIFKPDTSIENLIKLSIEEGKKQMQLFEKKLPEVNEDF